MGTTRRDFLIASALPLAGLPVQINIEPAAPYNAMGERVGEVTSNSALVHTRLTATATRLNGGQAFAPESSSQGAKYLPESWRVEELEGVCPGQAGRVRLLYSTSKSLSQPRRTAWIQVDQDTDYTCQFALNELRPETNYYYAVETASSSETRRGTIGTFRTAPVPSSWRSIKFCVATCQQYQRRDDPGGFQNYRSIKNMAPDFMAMVGDNVYYDNESPIANSVALARYHWQRMHSLPNTVEAFHSFGCYWTKDDHDILSDDCWPGMQIEKMKPLTFEDGSKIFREQIPINKIPYRKFRWGSGLEVWFTEGRDYRSPNNQADSASKSIWGEDQKLWLKQSLLQSNAQFKILINPTPIVGPDRNSKGDNHSNAAFATEGREFRQWVRDNKLKNLFVICGDRHWQYHSVDPETDLHEFSVGPMSDSHAGGTPGENKKYHRFHRVKGGFLSVTLEGTEKAPKLIFRHHDVHGNEVYQFQGNKEAN